MIVDLSDERRDKKPWLPADTRDVTNDLVVEVDGKPACIKRGAMNRVDRIRKIYRCSEMYCGVGAEVVSAMANAEENRRTVHGLLGMCV